MKLRALLTFVGMCVAVIGCGPSEDTTAAGGGGGGGSGGEGGGEPAADEIRFDTDVYELAPGEEKNYMCFTTRLPADQATQITKITPVYGAGMHHIGIYYTISDEPEGTFHCPELVRDNWIPLYVGGIDIGSLEMPPGSAIKLSKGRQVLVQLHLLNTTGQTVKDKSTIVFKTSDKADLVGAGIYGMDNRAIDIPPGSSDVAVDQTCTMPWDMDVFAVNGHMHTLGKEIQVSRGAALGDEMIYTQKWEFEDQPTVPLSFKITKGDSMHVRCLFDNPTAQPIGYGESSLTEMCAFVFYYTPYKSINGCIKSP